MEENNDNVIQTAVSGQNTITKTFLWMFMGLLATAIVAWATYSSGFIVNLVTNGTFAIILVVELVVVLVFSLLFRKLPASVVGALFFIYAAINGVTFSTIFVIFDLSSIVLVFFATAAIFGVCALYGHITKKDLSGWGTILIVTLIVGIILSVINIFVGNTTFDLVIDWVMLLLFAGFTIYDMQKIKNLANAGYTDSDKLHIYGAMELYLDFINMFLRILSIFGKRRD